MALQGGRPSRSFAWSGGTTLQTSDLIKRAIPSSGEELPVVGLGGAPGQCWEALELALERTRQGTEEILIVGGDHAHARSGEGAMGAALLLGRSGAGLRIDSIERGACVSTPLLPHAAYGLTQLVERAAGARAGDFQVPGEHTDGEAVTVRLGARA